MPSPPLVPMGCPIDEAHLARMTFNDPALEGEVLAMFSRQSQDIVARIAAGAADAAALAHTLKGSARAIGAFAVADAAMDFEEALRAGSAAAALDALQAAVADACEAIAERLRGA